MINLNNKKHNERWPQKLDHPYKVLIIGGSGSGKTNTLINIINEQNYVDKIYLYAKDLIDPKYEYLLKKRKDVGIKFVNNSNAFIEYSSAMDGVYEIINNYKPNRKRTFLIVFDDVIVDIMTNKTFQETIKELLLDAEN